MEMMLQFTNLERFINWERYKRVILVCVLVVFSVLIPSVVIADGLGGYDTEKLISRDGVADSQLVIGRDGVNNSWLDIAMGGSHLHEDNPAFQIVSLAPLLYALMLILVLVGLLMHLSFQTIIIAVIAINVAIAFLTGMQINITNLLR
ncbi:hypothetical protein LCGC14_0340830 [marine sediment metagenome]|uniref:Uncharacterized protein n=1 Tax=marine sediment metagenome TaxID=412755 RepID=A0A0F9W0X9_9ZZZZ